MQRCSKTIWHSPLQALLETHTTSTTSLLTPSHTSIVVDLSATTAQQSQILTLRHLKLLQVRLSPAMLLICIVYGGKETVESRRQNEDGLQQTMPIPRASAKAVASRDSSASLPPSPPRLTAFLSPARRRAQTAGLALAAWAAPPSILQRRAVSRGRGRPVGLGSTTDGSHGQSPLQSTTPPSHGRSSSSSRRSYSMSHPDWRANPNAGIHVRQDQVTHMHRLSEYQNTV
jgi:hypothetical protein